MLTLRASNWVIKVASGPVTVKKGHKRINDVRFANPVEAPSGIDVMTFARLREFAREELFASSQRPAFHVLIVVDRGTSATTVDFSRYPLTSGRVVWVRPGQVQTYDSIDRVEGTLVLFEPHFLSTDSVTDAADDVQGLQAWEIPPDSRERTRRVLQNLTVEYAGLSGTRASRLGRARETDLLRHLLAVAILCLLPEPSAPSPAKPGSATFLAFQNAIEQDFRTTRHVIDYARKLGYSPRTLSRAASAETRMGAKELIDRRVILEARRLLAHTDRPISIIADQLGFDDTANFAKFFIRGAGVSPGTFRKSVSTKG